MAKNLKLTIKNTQIAQAINLDALKSKLADKKGTLEEEPKKSKAGSPKAATKSAKIKKGEEGVPSETSVKDTKDESPKIRARSRSAFAEHSGEIKSFPAEELLAESEANLSEQKVQETEDAELNIPSHQKTSEQLRKEIFAEEISEEPSPQPLFSTPFQSEIQEEILVKKAPAEKEHPPLENEAIPKQSLPPHAAQKSTPKPQQTAPASLQKPKRVPERPPGIIPDSKRAPIFRDFGPPQPKLGPTGRHINDLIPPRPTAREEKPQAAQSAQTRKPTEEAVESTKQRANSSISNETQSGEDNKKHKSAKFKEFRDVKPTKKVPQNRFDARDRQGLRDSEEDQHWRKRKAKQVRHQEEDVTIRPTSLAVRIPIAIKDLA